MTLIEKYGTLHEAQLLPRSFGDGSLVKGQLTPSGAKQLTRELPTAFRGLRSRQGHPRKALVHPKLPDQKHVRKIFHEIESHDERIELNMYIVGGAGTRRARRSDMKLAYWPGCVSRGFTPELHGSMAKVAPLLDLELVELDRANCCGAGVIAEHNQELADTLNARTFAMAQQVAGRRRDDEHLLHLPGRAVRVPAAAGRQLELPQQVNTHLEPEGLSYEAGGDWWNKNFLWILAEEIGFDALRERVGRPLEGLRIAPFYGCYIVRPSKRLGFDEHPSATNTSSLLIEALGGEAVEYAGARKCCGFPVITMNRTTSLRQAGRHLADAIDAGADCLVTPCPLCHLNLDLQQPAAQKFVERDLGIPVLHLPRWSASLWAWSRRSSAWASTSCPPTTFSARSRSSPPHRRHSF